MKIYVAAFAVAASIVAVPNPAQAQFRFFQITGAVYDSATVEPLYAAVVTLEGTQLFGVTDAAGEFALNNVQPGVHVLQFHRRGFVPRRFEVDLSNVEPGPLNLGSVLLSAEPAGVSVLGTVMDSLTGAPIVRSVVSVNGSATALTNANGAFRVDEIAPGPVFVEIRRIGYTPLIIDTVLTEGAVAYFKGNVPENWGVGPENMAQAALHLAQQTPETLTGWVGTDEALREQTRAW